MCQQPVGGKGMADVEWEKTQQLCRKLALKADPSVFWAWGDYRHLSVECDPNYFALIF